jgi:hypothetical protein
LTPYSFSEKYSLLRFFGSGALVAAQDAALKHKNVIPSHLADSESAPPFNFNSQPLMSPAAEIKFYDHCPLSAHKAHNEATTPSPSGWKVAEMRIKYGDRARFAQVWLAKGEH